MYLRFWSLSRPKRIWGQCVHEEFAMQVLQLTDQLYICPNTCSFQITVRKLMTKHHWMKTFAVSQRADIHNVDPAKIFSLCLPHSPGGAPLQWSWLVGSAVLTPLFQGTGKKYRILTPLFREHRILTKGSTRKNIIWPPYFSFHRILTLPAFAT